MNKLRRTITIVILFLSVEGSASTSMWGLSAGSPSVLNLEGFYYNYTRNFGINISISPLVPVEAIYLASMAAFIPEDESEKFPHEILYYLLLSGQVGIEYIFYNIKPTMITFSLLTGGMLIPKYHKKCESHYIIGYLGAAVKYIHNNFFLEAGVAYSAGTEISFLPFKGRLFPLFKAGILF